MQWRNWPHFLRTQAWCELVEWARRLDAAHIAVGQSVRISAARSRWMYLVLEGSGLVTRDGRAHTILRPGDCELPGDERVTFSLVALTPITVLSIPHWAADELGIPWPMPAATATAAEEWWPSGGAALRPWVEHDILPEHEDATDQFSYRG